MDPELESSVENEAARQAAAREAARRGFSAYRQTLGAPVDEVPYMLAAPEQPPVSTQPIPQTPAEVVRSLDVPRVHRPQPATTPQPTGPQPAVGAPAPANLFNPGQALQPAEPPAQQGVGVIPPETFVSPLLPEAAQDFQTAEQLLRQRGVYTGIPTRVRTVQTQTTPGEVSPETLRALTTSDLDRRAALKFRAAQQAEGLGQQGGIFEQADLESQLEAQRQQQAAEDQARTMQWQTQRADNINQQVLSGRIDPNRVLGDSFSGGRIAAALGLFVSGLAQGETGANAFLQMINQTIDRDIAAQMANMENLRAGAQNQQNLVGMYRTVFGDETAAREAARATMLQSVAQKLQAQQARMGQAGQQPALMMALAELDAQQASAAAAAQQAQSSTVRTMTQTQSSGGVRGGPNIPLARAYMQLGQAREQAGARAVQGVREGMETVGQLQQQAAPPDIAARVERYGMQRRSAIDANRRASRIQAIINEAKAVRANLPGVGPFESRMPSFLLGEKGRVIRDETQAMIESYLHSTTGAVASEVQREAADNLIRGLTEGDYELRFNEFLGTLDEGRRYLDASFGPAVVQTFEAQLPPPPPQPIQTPSRTPRR